MLKQKIAKLLKTGETYNIEFKECKREINKDVYETVCAFLNRSGGELLLGVNDSGIINIADFTPFPKNPIISSFFRQIHYS
jgi:ATP-dependent DNA helicase RecG